MSAVAHLPLPLWAVEFAADEGYSTIYVNAAHGKGAVAIARRSSGERREPLQVYQLMQYDELSSLPHRGLRAAIDLSWDRRDSGNPYLVIERGPVTDDERREYWTSTGRIVRSVWSPISGNIAIATIAEADRKRGAFGIFDVIPRNAVQIIECSCAPGVTPPDVQRAMGLIES